MFYSHEILTSSQYGVATIWMVATVGTSLSTQKRLNRKSIQDVNVPKACEKILDPGAPLALRLQGSLLYGVSRVFAHQCGYVLSDAEKTQSDMKLFYRTMQTSEIDPKAGKTKRHNIILEDDPSFDLMSAIPSLDILNNGKDLLLLPSQGSANKYSQMTPLVNVTQMSVSSGQHGSLMDIDVPPSSHSAGSFRLPTDLIQKSSPLGKAWYLQEDMPEFQPFGQDDVNDVSGIALEFDDDGNLVRVIEPQLELPEFPPFSGTLELARNTSKPVCGNEEQSRPHDGNILDLIEPPLPDAEAFPSKATYQHPDAISSAHGSGTSVTTDVTKVRALNRRAPRRKVQNMLDEVNEVPRRQLHDWDDNYAQHMHDARKKQKHSDLAQAKKNAFALMYSNGLAGVGHLEAPPNGYHLLAEDFAGVPFRARLQGRFPDESDFVVETKQRRRKRSDAFKQQEIEENETRKVRQRAEPEVEMGRDNIRDDNGNIVVGDESALEIGMEAIPAMDDQHSSAIMPWSRASSAVPGSSIRAPGSAHKVLSAASPLHGRESIGDSIGRHSDLLEASLDSDDLIFQEPLSMLNDTDGDIKFHHARDTQASGSYNPASQQFLSYIAEIARQKGKIRETPEQRQQQLTTACRWMAFEDIIDSKSFNKAVATEAFVHILALATKNEILVEQDGDNITAPFGEIHVGIPMINHGVSKVSDDEDELA